MSAVVLLTFSSLQEYIVVCPPKCSTHALQMKRMAKLKIWLTRYFLIKEEKLLNSGGKSGSVTLSKASTTCCGVYSYAPQLILQLFLGY